MRPDKITGTYYMRIGLYVNMTIYSRSGESLAAMSSEAPKEKL
jgi:hypothetical protein